MMTGNRDARLLGVGGSNATRVCLPGNRSVAIALSTRKALTTHRVMVGNLLFTTHWFGTWEGIGE